jgi:hypothetical protein
VLPADPKNPRANQRHPDIGPGVEAGTIETVLGKSDLEQGLELLLGKGMP